MERSERKTGNVKSAKIKAILCILAAAFGFSLMTFFVRLSGDLPTMQKAFFRNAIAALVTVMVFSNMILLLQGPPDIQAF